MLDPVISGIISAFVTIFLTKVVFPICLSIHRSFLARNEGALTALPSSQQPSTGINPFPPPPEIEEINIGRSEIEEIDTADVSRGVHGRPGLIQRGQSSSFSSYERDGIDRSSSFRREINTSDVRRGVHGRPGFCPSPDIDKKAQKFITKKQNQWSRDKQ